MTAYRYGAKASRTGFSSLSLKTRLGYLLDKNRNELANIMEEIHWEIVGLEELNYFSNHVSQPAHYASKFIIEDEITQNELEAACKD
ncbi:hypothetical protein TSTA_033630 [Talaromyces stipitatus ATCC 10500]|uniref:Uncharacterized protein n=1 Tax=Talaromyces stipitatus (strain ATCC 10500 / CBS 375.48 / QM 6759 / NRRL 1006) TaxID=441959 RepID=B8M5Z3_TALSN|nr:uncharacterized protein TSTA_033630 [Talaromyces stipitatus ATCC 10500]EED20120.1 hypothetical protein TSTA_033630 [Talaromyces stipitatus ATCC 10500]